MKVYILTINKVHPNPETIYSNYIAIRDTKSVEYYASRSSAEKRRDEIYQGLKNLVGFIDGVEAVIEEKELKP